MKQNLNQQQYNNHRLFAYGALFAVASIMLLIRIKFFSIDYYLSPQVIPTEFEGQSMEDLRNYAYHVGNKFTSFLLFFILDMFLPVVLFASAMFTLPIEKRTNLWLVLSSVISIICNIGENISFILLDLDISTIKNIQSIKNISYLIFFIFWFYHIYRFFLQGKINLVVKAIIGSLPSLIIVALFSLLLTQMDQGTPLIVELLSENLNFIYFLFLVIFSSIIISHYPIFIHNFIFPNSKLEWKYTLRFKIFPIIYFNVIKDKSQISNIENRLKKLKTQGHFTNEITELLKNNLFPKNINQESEQVGDFEILKYAIIKPDANESVKATFEFKNIIHELDTIKKEKEADKIMQFVRHYLGSFLFIGIIYVLLFTYLKVFYQKPGSFAFEMVAMLSLIILFFHIFLYKARNGIRDNKVNQYDYNIDRLKMLFLIFDSLLIIQAFLLVARVIIFDDWSEFNILYSILQFGLAMISYILFRELRSAFKYRYGLSKSFFIKSDSKETLIDKGYDYSLSSGFRKNSIFRELNKIKNSLNEKYKPGLYPQMLLGNVSHNEYFILVSIILNILFALFIIYHALFNLMELNAVNYLLTFIMIYYGIIIFFLKWIFYKERNINTEQDKRTLGFVKNFLNKFTKPVFASYLSFLLLGIIAYGLSTGNDLHLLESIDNQYDNHVSLQEFKEAIPYNKDSVAYAFTVSSFGGGLKANYYTLKLLQKIQKETNNSFLKNTLSLSGVSGGGIGLANYYLIDGYENAELVDNKIKEIGALNILSIDCSYLLFQDFWREIMFFLNPKHTDRSHRAMQEYKDIILTHPKDFDELSYRDVHSKIIKNKSFYPNLLMNSTSTKLEYGIAQSVNEVTLPGAIDILDIKRVKDKLVIQKSLSFYDAASTVNRFPIFSPAAEIENKGHFVDGGYFENSGMLSTLSFLDRLGEGKWAIHEPLKLPQGDKNIVMLSFVNSKQHWVKEVISRFYKSEKNIIQGGQETTEIKAVLNTVTGTEMLPNYFMDFLDIKSRDNESALNYIPIYMPYLVNYTDVVNFLKAEPIRPDELIKFLELENQKIYAALAKNENYKDSWGIVEPALARNLSIPDQNYQDAMISYHESIVEKINLIKSFSDANNK